MSQPCSACGTTAVPGSRFCHGCGARLPASDPALAERFTSPIRYTPRHLAERILATRSALEGEHKRLTVVFCDIAGSTGLAELLGAEAMYQLVNRFFDIALAEIHRYEGTINQFLGDGFMALFGAPLALEQHERQAVLGAVGLQRAIGEGLRLPTGTTDRLQLRFGINTGPVVVGKIGDNLRMDYTAVGDTTNAAARLQALAEPNTILLSGMTYERARGVIDAESLGDFEVKGRSRPIAVYRVSGLRASRSANAGLMDAPRAPFVARRHELESLQDALVEAEASRGLAVGIVGEPGMGKTRLLGEFRRNLDGRRVTYLEARCVPYGRTIPYLPILDLLRANCQFEDLDTPEIMMGKVRAAVETAGLESADALVPLLHLLGLKDESDVLSASTPEAVQRKAFGVLRELCLRGSGMRPLVLVVEDMHWIDQTSEAFLASLAEVLGGTAILLLVTYRPGYSAPWVGKSYATQLALRPLSEAASRELLRSVVPAGADPDLLEREVLERGEGNPLFIEELAQALAMPVASVPAVATVPQTLHAVLAARIDRLPDQAKHLLQIASVVGREFSSQLIGRIWDGQDDPLPLLRELVKLELLHERTWLRTPVYVFKHALTREAAYGTLLESRRRVYHATVGRAIEALYGGRLLEVVDLLAYHFGLSDEHELAVNYSIAAAEKARRRWANKEAIDYYTAALQRLSAMPDSWAARQSRIDAVLGQAEIRVALGQQAEQIAQLEEIRGLVETTADSPRRAAWHYWMGFLLSFTGARPEPASEHCREAVAIAEQAGLDEIRAQADTCLAQVYLLSGRLGEALEAGERALAIFEARGNHWWASRALSQLSPAANACGQWQRGLEYCRRALEHGDALNDRRLRISALIRFASTLIQRGDSEAGLRYCSEAFALDPAPYDRAAAQAIEGYGRIKSGQAEIGVAQIQEALTWYEQSHLRYTRTLFAIWQVEGWLALGDRERADRAVQVILATSRDRGYRHLEGVALRLLGLCLRPDDASRAQQCLDSAVAILCDIGAAAEEAKARAARDAH